MWQSNLTASENYCINPLSKVADFRKGCENRNKFVFIKLILKINIFDMVLQYLQVEGY